MDGNSSSFLLLDEFLKDNENKKILLLIKLNSAFESEFD